MEGGATTPGGFELSRGGLPSTDVLQRACQKVRCVGLRVALRESEAAQTKLRNEFDLLTRDFERRVLEAQRTIQGTFIEKLDALENAKKQSEWDTTRFRNRWNSVGNNHLANLETIALLKAEVSQLKKERAASRRDEAREARARQREMTKAFDAVRDRDQLEETLKETEEALTCAAEEAADAAEEAETARQDAMDERDAADAARSELDNDRYSRKLVDRQLEYTKSKAEKLKARLDKFASMGGDRSADEWSALSREARLKAHSRERASLHAFLTAHQWQASDLAFVCDQLGYFEEMFETKQGWRIYFGKVKQLHSKLEHEDFGVPFGLFLHFDMKLTFADLQRIHDAGCKKYNRKEDRSKKSMWLANKFTGESLGVPRIIPARTKLEPVKKDIAKLLGVEYAENGLLAYRSFDAVLQDLVTRDAGRLMGKNQMPTLDTVLSGKPFPLVISRDATGKGSLQFTTFAARSPLSSKSAQMLHIFGVGSCGDGRAGSQSLLGPNLIIINKVIKAADEGRPYEIVINGGKVGIFFEPYFVDDVSCLRHGEMLANSGWCGCSRHRALREIPVKPKTKSEMRILVDGDGPKARCRELACFEREVLSHTAPEGEDRPRPCIVAGCSFGHGSVAKVEAEYAALLAKEAELLADTSKTGKQRLSAWQMEHAWKGKLPHFNVRPGERGKPMLRHHMMRQILDALHLAKLGLPKCPWKHGIKNNSSEECRDRLSEQLKEWRHPLEMGKKGTSTYQRENKWFTGEKWASFCAGKSGSPGGPIAIATLVMIIADDLTRRGVDSGEGEAKAIVPVGVVSKKPAAGGRNSFADRQAAAREQQVNAAAKKPAVAPKPTVADVQLAERTRIMKQPSTFELELPEEDKDCLKVIREIYGSRATTLINILLSFDAYFAWYYPYNTGCALDSTVLVKEERALENCRTAIDMQEMFERVSFFNHGSFLPHSAVFKISRDILLVADPNDFDLSALELQNAETKRVFESAGSRHMTFAGSIEVHRKDKDGVVQLLTTTKRGALISGSRGSTSVSILTHLLSTGYLRRGDGLYTMPDSRRSERLFGDNARGRTSNIKLEVPQAPGYKPEKDSCVRALALILAMRATNTGNSCDDCE